MPIAVITVRDFTFKVPSMRPKKGFSLASITRKPEQTLRGLCFDLSVDAAIPITKAELSFLFFSSSSFIALPQPCKSNQFLGFRNLFLALRSDYCLGNEEEIGDFPPHLLVEIIADSANGLCCFVRELIGHEQRCSSEIYLPFIEHSTTRSCSMDHYA
jgi:hypothetical protein